MATKVCPNCGWRKDIATEVCHCGYDFVSGMMGTEEEDAIESETAITQSLEVEVSLENMEVSDNETEGVPAGTNASWDDDSSALNKNLAFMLIGYLFGYLIPALFVLFGRGFSFDIQIFANPFVVPGALLGWIGGRMGGYAGAVAAGIICGIVLFVVLAGLTSA